MVSFRYYLGLNIGDAIKLDAETVKGEIVTYLLTSKTSLGVTILTADGWYKGNREQTLVIELSGIDEEKHDAFLTWLCETYNQECIAFAPIPELAFYARSYTKA